MVNKWINTAQSLLFPSTCILCGAPGSNDLDICSPCRQELPVNTNCCRLCAAPITAIADCNKICGKCMVSPPVFDQCIAPFLYLEPVDHLISGFKFRQKLGSGKLLSLLLLDFLRRIQVDKPDVIMPVPLHRKRLTERGYNQAVELARPIGKHFKLPLDLSSCVRRHLTLPQMSLKKQSRLRNIKGAFEIRKEIRFRHLVLIDDVVTTGATVSELAALLKKCGAARVDVWALARTP